MNQRRITGDGLELSLTERGDPDAPTVVLVHGYPDTSAVWHPVADLLALDHHVVTYDVRGAGSSDVPTKRADFELAHLVNDLEAVIDATSPDKPVHLVGHDWGSIQSWEAVVTPRLATRIASYTSISGPPLDHVGLWLRAHLKFRPAALRAVLAQGQRSWYIGAFNLPLSPQLAKMTTLGGQNRRFWARGLERLEGVSADEHWPAPTFASDFAAGMHLYRANVLARVRNPTPARAPMPVQVIVPREDHYVTPALLDGLEDRATDFYRREVPAGHWVVRTRPTAVARWIRELIDHVEGGPEPRGLERASSRPHQLDAGRVVVVTGAGSGIGRAAAVAFAERGATVIAADIDEDAALYTSNLCAVSGRRAEVLGVDVSDLDSMEAFTKQVTAQVGVPDVVVNNAGIAVAGAFLDTPIEEWNRIMGVNFWGVLYGSRLFARQMVDRAEGGHIVNVASAAAFAPSRNYPAYATTKAAVLMLTQCLRQELADEGIGVSAICPGFAKTGIAMATRYVGTGFEEQEALRRRADRAYQRRNLSPEAIAKAIVRAVETNEPVIAVGAEAHIAQWSARLFPGLLRRFGAVQLPGFGGNGG